MKMQPPLRHVAMACSLLVLAACSGGSADHALQQARDTMAATLPAPYVEDLVIESVLVEGNALVQIVRSPEGDALKTREHPRFDELQQAEQDDLLLLCALPAVQSLAGTDARLVRRFVDRNDQVFFEVELPARDCGGDPQP